MLANTNRKRKLPEDHGRAEKANISSGSSRFVLPNLDNPASILDFFPTCDFVPQNLSDSFGFLRSLIAEIPESRAHYEFSRRIEGMYHFILNISSESTPLMPLLHL